MTKLALDRVGPKQTGAEAPVSAGPVNPIKKCDGTTQVGLIDRTDASNPGPGVPPMAAKARGVLVVVVPDVTSVQRGAPEIHAW